MNCVRYGIVLPFAFQSLILVILTEEMTGHVRPHFGKRAYIYKRSDGDQTINGWKVLRTTPSLHRRHRYKPWVSEKFI